MTDKMKVFVRLRPPVVAGGYATQGGYEQVLKYTDHRVCPLQGKEAGRGKDGYLFQRVFQPEATNSGVFEEMKEVVSGALDGVSGTVLAYGQTATGKTHTMRGSVQDPGVIERVLRQVFCSAAERQGQGWQTGVEISYFEIHNERVYDLLSGAAKELEVRCDAVHGLLVEDAGRFEDGLSALHKGDANRKKSKTDLNEYSSRSHTVFRIQLTGVNNALGKKRKAVLHLVDLAGSESAKGAGYQNEATAREGSAINKSLLALTNVIKSLADKSTHINYRDSKLTRLLSNSLGGSARTYLICCVTSEVKYFAETMSTIHFADRARVVYNAVKVNEVDGTLGIAFSDYAQLRDMHLEDMAVAEKREKQLREGTAHQVALALEMAAKDHEATTQMLLELDYTMQKEVARLRAVRDECERREAKKDEEIAQLRESAKRAKEKVKAKEAELKAALANTEEAGVLASKYEGQISTLSAEVEAVEKRAAEVTKEAVAAKEALETAEKEQRRAAAALKDKVEALQKEQRRATAEAAGLKDKVEALQKEAAAGATRLVAADEHVVVLQSEIASRDAKLLTFENNLAAPVPAKRTSTEAFPDEEDAAPAKKARKSVEVTEVVVRTTRYDAMKDRLQGVIEHYGRPVRVGSPPAGSSKVPSSKTRSATGDGKPARKRIVPTPLPLAKLAPSSAKEAHSNAAPTLLSSLAKEQWPDTARHGSAQPRRARTPQKVSKPSASPNPVRRTGASPNPSRRAGMSPAVKRLCSASPLPRKRTVCREAAVRVRALR